MALQKTIYFMGHAKTAKYFVYDVYHERFDFGFGLNEETLF